VANKSANTGLVNIKADPTFRGELEQRGALNLSRCIQCLKCASGCPAAFAMDYNPAQIIRMAILGLKEDVLSSHTIWLCSDCKTCATRCPMEIDVAGAMDIIKEMAVEQGGACPENKVKVFHDTFMGVIRARGRMNEPLLFGYYKLRTGTFTEDIDAGRQMFFKGKIKYKGKSKGHGEVRKIVDKLKGKP
jgi:heterodisulfide reductase subunit C2